MPSPGSRRWLRWGLVAVVVVLVLAGGAVAFVLAHAPHNVSHPNVEFTAPDHDDDARRQDRAPSTTSRGRATASTPGARTFRRPQRPEPPLHVGWRFEDYALLEFPPVIYQNSAVPDGRRRVGEGADSRPATSCGRPKVGHAGGRLTGARDQPGAHVRLAALDSTADSTRQRPVRRAVDEAPARSSGRSRSRPAPSPRRSRWGNAVYFGDQGGTVYSLNATTGQVNWTYHASGAVKGGPALSNGALYFGDYSGRAYALNAANGHQVWAVNTNGADFGFGSGNFYSTPASRSAASTWATPTGASTRSRAEDGRSSPGRPARAPTCTHRRPSTTPPGSGRPSTSAPTTATSTRSTPNPARSVEAPGRRQDLGLGDHRRQRRLLLRPRHQDDRRAGRAHRPQVFSFPDGAFNAGGMRRHRNDLPERLHDALPDASGPLNTELAHRANLISTPHSQRLDTTSYATRGKSPRIGRAKRSQGTCVRELPAILMCLCVVVVEVTARNRPRRAAGSARSTRQSSIACARSSRTPPPPASVVVARSARLLAAVLAVMSPAFRPPRTAMRAPRPDTWKRPLKRGRFSRVQHKLAFLLDRGCGGPHGRSSVCGAGARRVRRLQRGPSDGRGLPHPVAR